MLGKRFSDACFDGAFRGLGSPLKNSAGGRSPHHEERESEAYDARTLCRLAYLEQIFCQLRRASLVKSVRGPGGGYLLGRPAAEITAGEIVRAVEGDVDASQCRGEATCRGGAECLAHGLWPELNVKMAEFLNSQTLQSIKDRNLSRAAALSAGACAEATVPVSQVAGRHRLEHAAAVDDKRSLAA